MDYISLSEYKRLEKVFWNLVDMANNGDVSDRVCDEIDFLADELDNFYLGLSGKMEEIFPILTYTYH